MPVIDWSAVVRLSGQSCGVESSMFDMSLRQSSSERELSVFERPFALTETKLTTPQCDGKLPACVRNTSALLPG